MGGPGEVVVRELLQVGPQTPSSTASAAAVVMVALTPSLASLTGYPPPPYPISFNANSSDSGAAASFKPSIAVIIGVLTTMFSLTFLLLLYAKHCKRSPNISPEEAFPNPRAQFQTDSGIDRSVVEGLPMFTFGSLQGMKEGLECAVCLSRFEQSDILRLLPKCKHAFHLGCVDTWLVSHSTCPLCRHFITAEDNLAVEDIMLSQRPPVTPEDAVQEAGIVAAPRNSSARGPPPLLPLATPLPLSPAASGSPHDVFHDEDGDSPPPFRRFSYADGEALPKGSSAIARKDGLLLGVGGVGDWHWSGGGQGGDSGGHGVGGGGGGAWGIFRKSFESNISPVHRAVTRHFRRQGQGQGQAQGPLPSPDNNSSARRLGHRIVIADVVMQHRWSDFVPSDVLFLHTNTLFGPEEKARVSVSTNEGQLPPLSLALTAGGGDSLPLNLPNNNNNGGKASSKKTKTAKTAKTTTTTDQDLELGLEPPGSRQLPAGKPSKSIKLDCESRALALLTRASSFKSPSNPDELGSNGPPAPATHPYRHIQRSMSEITGLGRVAAHSRMSSRDLLLARSSSRVFQTADQEEKSRKWSTIARRTLNWVMGGSRGDKSRTGPT